MEEIQYLVKNYGEIILLINFGLIILLTIIIIIQGIKISNISSKYNKIFKSSNIENIEDLLLSCNEEVGKIKINNIEMIKDLNRVQIELNKSYSKSALINYDAFDDRAGRLSFVYVLLNSYNSGILVNGLYNNAGHYIYLKSIENGEYVKELTKEENDALTKAINSKE